MVHSIPTVTHLNHYIYVLEPGQHVRVVAIPNGYYSADKLTQILPAALDVVSHDWGCTYDGSTNTFQISNSSFSFRFLTDKELSDLSYSGISYPSDATPDNPKSFNHILQNYAGSSASTGATSYTFFADLQPFSYLQLRSKRLSSKNVISARNEHDILLKIPLDVAYGDIIKAETPGFDSITVGRTLHRNLDFSITDYLGNVIETLYDTRISFILVLYG